MSQVSKAIQLAKSQENYVEDLEDDGVTYDNHQIYSPDIPGLEWSQDMPWCQTFQAWVFSKTGLSTASNFTVAPITASVYTSQKWFAAKGRLSKFPSLGCIAFMGENGFEHVGLVYGFDQQYIYTVEANTSNGVRLRQRLWHDNDYVVAFGMPIYDEVIVTADPAFQGITEFTFAESVKV